MRKAFDERRLEMVKLLRAIPGVHLPRAEGRVLRVPRRLDVRRQEVARGLRCSTTTSQLCDWLVEVGKVAVVPGSGFGAPGYVRLSYACSMQNIQEGVGRLAKALGSLR